MKKGINREKVKNAIVPVLYAGISTLGFKCFMAPQISNILSMGLLTVFFILIYAVTSFIQTATKWKITVPGVLSLCLSVFMISLLWAMHWLPAECFPRQAITLIPDVREESLNNGEIYLVDVHVNEKSVKIQDLDVQFEQDSGWIYISEYDDYKLPESNFHSSDDSLTLLFNFSDDVTLYFSKGAYGGDFWIQTAYETQSVSSFTLDENEVGAMPAVIFKGAASFAIKLVIYVLLMMISWIVLYTVLLLLWNRKSQHRLAYRVIDEKGKVHLQTGWLISCAVFSLIISLGFIFGREYSYWSNEIVLPTARGLIMFLVLFFSGTLTCYIGFPYLEMICHAPRKSLRVHGMKSFLVFFLIFLLAWISVYLCAYPALVSSDTVDSIHQSIGDSNLNNHHPILFTLYLRFFFFLSDTFHFSRTIGLGLASLVQMMSLAALCAYAVFILMKRGCRRINIALITLYYALCGIFSFYSVTLWKDIFFGIALTAFSIQCYDIALDRQECKRFRQILLYCLTGTWISFARNNGIYVFIAVSILLAVMMWKQIHKHLVVLLCCIIAVVLIQGPGYKALNIPQSGFAESVSIPLQQIGYTATHEKLTEEETEQIEAFIPVDTLKSVYTPSTVDQIKFNNQFNSLYLNEHKIEFLKLWFSMLQKHPASFIKAYMGITDGFWNFQRAGWPIIAASTSYYEYEDLPFHSVDLIQSLFGYPLYERLFTEGGYNKILQSVPPMSWLVGLLFLICLIVIYKRNYKQLLSVAPLILLWGTLMIATPVAYEHRYLFSVYIVAPFALLLQINEKTHIKKERITNGQ